ncbi:MAG TPA: GntR family transcriptional regulator [Gemmatimonadales bacterium]|nr:GntR family transcriptional regulator [Gemmatimonadales bacterium]
MFFRPTSSSGVPIYVQLVDQVRHAVETGALKGGEQLPSIRDVAVRLAVNVNTVAKAYRELAWQGIVAVRHGSGAFVVPRADWPVPLAERRSADALMKETVARLRKAGLSADAIRRMSEAALADPLPAKPRRRRA